MNRAPEPRRARVPRWAAKASVVLAAAASRLRLIAANTPVNLRDELGRLTSVWQREGAGAPRFTYESAADHGELRRALDAIARELETEGALGAIYAARARELALEAALCEAAGGPALFALARRRYARRDDLDARADALARAWLDEGPAEPAAEASTSDDDRDRASLLSRLREEIGRLRLPMRVVVNANLASLAATGDRTVHVAAGRQMSPRDVERTVLHEIEGHVLPRLRGERAELGIFAVGTAWGSDDQEGRAIAIERSNGYLDHARRRELALRHGAAREVEKGSDFTSTTKTLLGEGAPLGAALRIAARAHRGGGLARECVYLPAFLRVEAAVRADASVDAVLRAGRVSVEAAPALRGFAPGPGGVTWTA